jgi:CheY-like chemotaxis protein
MKLNFANIDVISTQLKSVERRVKPKLLVVDDEPDNLDLLYRTFRRQFNVFKAESGKDALEILEQEGEVAVIISDQRMPEMKGTEFLSRTVPEFPDTVRIILTGFTDVEDLVDAINSGQVYKYITKPWDPNELKTVVDKASESYEVLKQRAENLYRAKEQTELMGIILETAQNAASTADCLEPIAEAFGKSFLVDTCILQQVADEQLSESRGCYLFDGTEIVPFANDPLVKSAIANAESQIWVKSRTTPHPEGGEHYAEAELQVHLVLPVTYRNKVLGVLSLQWRKSPKLSEDELQLIHLAVQQVALAMVTTA